MSLLSYQDRRCTSQSVVSGSFVCLSCQRLSGCAVPGKARHPPKATLHRLDSPQCRDQIETNHTCIFTHSSRDPSSPHQRRETFSMPSLSSLLTGLGTLLMMHAAYSCLHYRNMLQDLDLEGSYAIPPMDVYVEVAISFLFLLLGQLSAVGSFQSVEVFAKNHRPVVAPLYRTRDFDIYENRGKVIKSL